MFLIINLTITYSVAKLLSLMYVTVLATIYEDELENDNTLPTRLVSNRGKSSNNNNSGYVDCFWMIEEQNKVDGYHPVSSPNCQLRDNNPSLANKSTMEIQLNNELDEIDALMASDEDNNIPENRPSDYNTFFRDTEYNQIPSSTFEGQQELYTTELVNTTTVNTTPNTTPVILTNSSLKEVLEYIMKAENIFLVTSKNSKAANNITTVLLTNFKRIYPDIATYENGQLFLNTIRDKNTLVINQCMSALSSYFRTIRSTMMEKRLFLVEQFLLIILTLSKTENNPSMESICTEAYILRLFLFFISDSWDYKALVRLSNEITRGHPELTSMVIPATATIQNSREYFNNTTPSPSRPNSFKRTISYLNVIFNSSEFVNRITEDINRSASDFKGGLKGESDNRFKMMCYTNIRAFTSNYLMMPFFEMYDRIIRLENKGKAHKKCVNHLKKLITSFEMSIFEIFKNRLGEGSESINEFIKRNRQTIYLNQEFVEILPRALRILMENWCVSINSEGVRADQCLIVNFITTLINVVTMYRLLLMRVVGIKGNEGLYGWISKTNLFKNIIFDSFDFEKVILFVNQLYGIVFSYNTSEIFK